MAFAHAGFADTSMEAVAAAAGVTRLIVYRNFPSKEELYRAVLERVANMLGEEFGAIAGRPDQGRGAARALLRVARQHPDGFRLLWVHAAHEPAFASYAADWRILAVSYAADLLAPRLAEPGRLRWAAEVVVDHVYDAVLAWLDEGDPARDEVCVELVAHGLQALIAAWASVP